MKKRRMAPRAVLFIVLAIFLVGGSSVYVGVKNIKEGKMISGVASSLEKAEEKTKKVSKNKSTASRKKAATKEVRVSGNARGVAVPIAAGKLPEGNLPGLCASSDECLTYCTQNVKSCLSFCSNDSNASNTLCREMNGMLAQFGMSPEMLSFVPDSMLSGMAKQMGEMFTSSATSFDIKNDPLPLLAERNFIDLERIVRISKFRSGYGHDYSLGAGESCRSMKHYFWADGGDPGKSHNPPWTNISLYAPADGTIWRMQKTGGEAQFALRAKEHGAFSFIFHHVRLASGIGENVEVKAGQKLGNIASDNNHGEIAVEVLTKGGRSLISFFEVAAPDVLALYKAKGLVSTDMALISRSERDARPLQCDPNTVEGRFIGVSYDGLTDSAGIKNWIELH